MELQEQNALHFWKEIGKEPHCRILTNIPQ